MALTRLVAPQTTVQPTQGTTPTDVQAEVALQQQGIKSEQATQQIAGQVHQFGASMMREEALKMAQEDAAKSVTIDPETGEPVYNKEAKGWGGLVYNKAFDDAAISNYRTHALGALNRKAELALAQYPNNPDKVREVLQPYVETTLKAMPEHFATQLAPHFSGVVNAARASSLAGKARSDISGISNSLKGDYQSIVLDMGRLIAGSYSGGAFDIPEGPQKAAIDQRLANHAAQQAGTGLSEADQKISKEQAYAHARAHAFGMIAGRNIVAAVAQGPEAVARVTADTYEQLQSFSLDAQNTPYFDQLHNIAMSHINRAQGVAGARDQALSHNTNEVSADFRRRSEEIKRAYQAGEISEGTARSQGLALESERGLAMQGRRPTHALAIMTAGSETIAAALPNATVEQQQWQRTRDARDLGSHQSVAANIIDTHTNSTNPAARREAVIQAEELRDNAFVTNRAGVDPAYQQIRGAMGKLVAQSVANASAFERTEAMEKLRSGRVDKEHIPGIIQSWIDNNTIGPNGMSYEQAVTLAAEGARNSDARKAVDARAQSARETIARGGVPSADEAKAIAEQDRVRAGGGITAAAGGSTTSVSAAGEVTTRPAKLDAVGVKQALDHSATNVNLPEAFLKEAAAVAERLQVDPDTQKGLVNLVRGWEQQRINSMTTTLSNPRELHTTVAALSKQHFGAKVLEAARIYEKGHGEATPEMISTEMAKLGIKPERQIDKSSSEWSNVASAVLSNGIVGKSIDARDFDPSSLSQRAGRLWLSEMGLNSNAYLYQFPAFSQMKQRLIFGNGLPAEANESNMHISGVALKNLTDWQITKYLPAERDSDLKQDFNPIEQGSTIWMNENKSKLSWVKSTDPVTKQDRFTLTYKGFEEELKNANPSLKDYSHDQINLMVNARMKAHFPAKYQDTVPGSIRVTGEESALGQMIYKVTGKSISGGGTNDFTWVDPKDKQWNAEGEIVSNTVARVMKDTAAKSIWAEYVTHKFFREDAMKEIRNKVLEDFSDKKDVGESWSRLWHSVRNLVGDFKGVPPESYNRHMAPEIGRAIGWEGIWNYIFSPGEAVAVPRRPFDTRSPSTALPAQPGQHSMVDILTTPQDVNVSSGADPAQYFQLRNKENARQLEQFMRPAPTTLPGGYTPPPIDLRVEDQRPTGPVEPPEAKAARRAEEIGRTVQPGRPQPTVPFGSVRPRQKKP